MRPTTILGTAAALLLATFAISAGADSTPPAPQIKVSGGTITVTAQGSTHVNSGFPWKFLDSTGAKAKQLADFAFTGGSSTAPVIATVNGAPAAGTLRGGYCQDSGCYTFTASCTAASCTITGP
jgi:hypothetical protein